ncbi:MAG: UPF0146 family protein [Candidatus Freyarchaeum deiterrae]
MKLIDTENIIEYIVSNYSNSRKIVEVGVGRLPEIAIALKEKLPDAEIIVTDVIPNILVQLSNCHHIKSVIDDVTSPNMRIYKNSDLIYSIRPPPELQYYLLRIANTVKSDLILRLLTNETVCVNHPKHRIINYKKTVLNIFQIKEG